MMQAILKCSGRIVDVEPIPGDLDCMIVFGGVVILKRSAIVFYTFAKAFGGHQSFIPTIDIEGKDFALIIAPVEDDPDCFEATWDDVPKLLNHPKFPLMLAEFPKDSPSMTTE